MLCACSYWNPFKLAWKMKRRKKTEKDVESTQSINCQRVGLNARMSVLWLPTTREVRCERANERISTHTRTSNITVVHANNNYIISYELHCNCGFFDTIDIFAITALPFKVADYVVNGKRSPNKREAKNNWSIFFSFCRNLGLCSIWPIPQQINCNEQNH